MTARTRTAKKTAEATDAPASPGAKKTATKRVTAAKATAPRTRRTRKSTAKLSLVNREPLPVRTRDTDDFMPETHIHATHTARLAGIETRNIRADWHDHWDGTCTRRLRDGSHLQYNLDTHALTWHTHCPMGAIHVYELVSRAQACAVRLHAAGCNQPHADLSTIEPLTDDERKELGLTEIQDRTLARPDLLDDITETIAVPLPEQRERALADTLAHAAGATDDTQPMSRDAITEGLAQRAADTEQPKEHPEP